MLSDTAWVSQTAEIAQFISGQALRLHGLNKDDVKLVTVPGPQLDETLRDRKADVVAVGAWQSPIAAKVAAEGGVRVLFTDHDVLGDITVASGRCWFSQATLAGAHGNGRDAPKAGVGRTATISKGHAPR